MSTHRRLYHVLSIVVVITMLFSGVSMPSAAAQGPDGIERQVNPQTGKVSFIGPENGQVLSASNALGMPMRPQDPALALAKRYAPEFGLKDPARDLKQIQSDQSNVGRITARYQQSYQGIPVMGGELIVNTNRNGDLYSMNGEVSSDLSLSTQPTIDAEQAKQTALQAVAKWYQKTLEDFIASEPELWIYDESLLRPSTRPAELVWRMEVTAKAAGLSVRELVLVHAQRGSISLHFNQVENAGASHPELSNGSVINHSKSENVPAFLGTTWYVSSIGNDSNFCTNANSPCKTINAAIGKAGTGDTVLVAAGTYIGTGTEVVLISKNIILSAGWNNTFTTQTGTSIIDGQGVRRGIKIPAGRVATLDRITVRNGKVSDSGAGIWNQGSLSLTNCVIENNQTPSASGGGIYSTGTLTISNSTIRNNNAGSGGGGIASQSALPVNINHTKIMNNHAGLAGGGISYYSDLSYIYDDASAIMNSTISGNTASGGGGVSMGWGRMTISNTAIIYNAANSFSFSNANGGGIKNDDGIIYVNNSTVSSNISNGDGGGIATIDDGKVYLNNATVSHNVIPVDEYGFGAGVYQDGFYAYQKIIAKNSLIAMNYGGHDCDGNLESNGYNLIGNVEGCTYTASTGDLVGTKENPIDPLISIPRDNGGSTFTNALFTSSPALNAGNPAAPGSSQNTCFVSDQRGVSRTDTCDIGAFEGSIAPVVEANAAVFTNQNQGIVYGLGTFLCGPWIMPCTNGVNPEADTAQVAAIGIHNLFYAIHNRQGVDNAGYPILITIDYDFHTFCPNASWDGMQIYLCDRMVADDIVAHEFTHGVTQHESNLFSYYQSGAISESLSDLWGEYYDQINGRGNDAANVKWQIGEDAPALGTKRSMSNPLAFGDPDKMSSVNYYEGEADSGGIHHNNGINNKAVYLMVAGGSFNGKTVSALGWDKTLAIYYEANTKLLSSGADYSDLYYTLQQACSNLIGQKGITVANCAEVKDAIDAVEMNGQPASNFNTNAPLCTTSGTAPQIIFADDLETGVANWTLSNGTYPRWQWDSPYGPYAQSGLHSLYADDYTDVITDTSARLKPIIVPSGAYLHFAQAYGFENGYLPGNPTLYNFDGGVLEYSTNSGSSWIDAGPLIDFNGYKGKVATGFGNPLQGRSAFVGSSHGYIGTRLNLASLAGKNVTFRWRMGLDEVGFAWGWWVDNIKVYTCGIPLPGVFNKTAPATGSINQPLNPTLRWGASSGVTSYQYCYDTINDNACATWISNGISASKALSGLSPNTTYYWHVRALNGGGTMYANGSPTAFWSFKTMPFPGAFSKTAPTDGATGISLSTTLAWDSSSNASSYQYCYDLIDDDQCNRTWSITPTTFVEISNLGANTTYYWQVRAINAAGTTAADGASWGSFKTTSTLPAGSSGIEARIGTTTQGKYSLGSGQSLRESYTSVNNGPVRLASTNAVPLIGAERVIYKVGGVQTSFTELMGLPEGQLDNVYWLPWYNNKDLDTQLRIANATDNPTTVTVTIGGVEMPSFDLAAGESTRVSYADVNDGPVQIESNQEIVAAERVIYTVQGTQTSFSEMMALPGSQLDTIYWLPWYNNKDLDTQLRIGNVSGSTATVHVFIGGDEVTPAEGIVLLEGESTRLSYPGVNDGPVQIVSDQNIVAAERVIYKVQGVQTSFSEMMALPESQLDTTYWLPWYNNKDLDTQVRFANTTNSTATVHIYVGGVEMQDSPFILEAGESTRQSFAGINNGPVQIESDVPIVVAERVIYKVQGIQTSFTEMMALPNTILDTTYWFPWYNNVGSDTQLRFGVP